ncbi:unnamed protein product [Rotaria sp. Silwood1]|nr:unnamed protein product [Rotaria sp. Silwood1]
MSILIEIHFRLAYTHFHELVDTWTKHAQAIETQTKNLSEKARVLGTSSDTPEIRSRLDEDVRRLHNLATNTKTVLKELADEMTKRRKELSRNDLVMVTKIKTDMINALKNYEDVITNVCKGRQQYQPTSNDTLIDWENANLSEDDVHRRLQLQQQMKMNNNLLIKQNEEQFAFEEQVQLGQRKMATSAVLATLVDRVVNSVNESFVSAGEAVRKLIDADINSELTTHQAGGAYQPIIR